MLVEFDGDEQAARGPSRAAADALRTLGVGIVGDAMPFRVRGTGTVRRHGDHRRLGVVHLRLGSASSQARHFDDG